MQRLDGSTEKIFLEKSTTIGNDELAGTFVQAGPRYNVFAFQHTNPLTNTGELKTGSCSINYGLNKIYFKF
jgi:hypothetical protein